ncbi:hypothetical protein Ndes2437B_g03932 [Nannochloris sp. 'desiccata']
MKLALFAAVIAGCLLAANGRVLLQSDGDLVQGQVSAGVDQACSIKSDGALFCWGLNAKGQLGDGTNSSRSTPTSVAGNATWMQISAGYHTCGIKKDGTAFCWGDNDYGRLGDGKKVGRTIPSAIAGVGAWTQISAGGVHGCGIKVDETAWCWGFNDGQVGDGTAIDKSIPTAVAGGGSWMQISNGEYHTCAIKIDETLLCWGRNTEGRLGDGSTSDQLLPTSVAGGGTWKLVSAGRAHTCGIKTDGTAWCWGSNQYGALGDGKGKEEGSNSTTPQLVLGGLKWLQVDAGSSSSCGIASDRKGWCWGWNGKGELGDGTSGTWKSEPVALYAPGITWSEISTGFGFACGITNAGMVACWGSNTYGQLGSKGPDANSAQKVSGNGTWGLAAESDTSGMSSEAPIGAIIGGVVGGIAIIAAVTSGLIIHRRRKAAANINAASTVKADSANGRPAPGLEDSAAVLSMSTMNKSSDPVLQWIASQPKQDSGISMRFSSSSYAIPDHLKALEFAWDDARILKPLGVGSFGDVYLAELHHSPVALKLLFDAKAAVTAVNSASTAAGLSNNNAQPVNNPSMASTDALVKEVCVMAPLRHQNVALLVGYCMNPPCVALEYASRGSLFDVLQNGNTDSAVAAELTWRRRLAMAADAAAGMLHLHTRAPPILHRDLKSPNLLVAADWTVKVADMGLSKLMDEANRDSAVTTGGAANPRWLAPEVLNGDNTTAAADVFSFGVVLWELLTWKLPWSDTPTVWNIVGNVLKGGRPALPPRAELPGLKPSDNLDAYTALIQRCWAQEPSARPDFNSIASELRALQSV